MTPFFFETSQTFFGVLLTLIALCVVFNGSNFIHEILDNIIAQIREQIEAISTKITSKDITDGDSYYIVRKFKDSFDSSTSSPEKKKVYNECCDWYVDFNNSGFNQSIKPSEKKKAEINNEIDRIKQSSEPNIAALYTFFYALFVMLLDCIIPYFPTLAYQTVNFCYFLTILSIIFWCYRHYFYSM